MADTGTKDREQTTGTTEFQQEGWQQSDTPDLLRQMFSGAQGQPIPAADMSQHFYELAFSVLRTAQRVSEVQVLYAWRQQIVSDVTREVLSQIQRSPGLIGQQTPR